MPKLIVCLTGMPGSGKTTIADGLKPQGYETLSMGDAVRDEAARRGLEPTRENLGRLMLELREGGGPGAVAELIRPKIESSASDVILVDGVRSNDEVAVLRSIGNVKLLAVHASTDVRFGFLQKRARSDDPQTRQHFDERDHRELGVGISDSIVLSDYTLSNVGLEKADLIAAALRVIRGWA